MNLEAELTMFGGHFRLCYESGYPHIVKPCRQFICKPKLFGSDIIQMHVSKDGKLTSKKTR